MTTIAVLSDVHGNTPALHAVLAEIDAQRPDVVVNLGDIASGGIDPRGTVTLLRQRPDIITVAGNHERQVLEGRPEHMSASDRHAREQLDEAALGWLSRLRARTEPHPGVLAFHGSPDDDLCYLLQTVDPRVEGGLREASDDEISARLGEHAGRHAVFLCGHTHLQRTRQLPDGTMVVNPGSVGWPAYEDDRPTPHRVEAGTAHARYTLLRLGVRTGDAADVVEHLVEYDVEAAACLALRNGRPDVAHALHTGRVGRPR